MSNELDDVMIALSIRQPWAELIVKGIKPIEIRPWKPAEKYIGKRILIHAGLKPSSEEFAQSEVTRMSARFNLFKGAIIGSAVLANFKRYEEYADWVIDERKHLNDLSWYKPELFGFIFEEPVEFDEPIPYKGMLNFFKVKSDEITIP